MMRGKIHSLHGGRKAYLNFELKDRRPLEAARLWRVLDFKVQVRADSAVAMNGKPWPERPLLLSL
jgi:hypothetical protein